MEEYVNKSLMYIIYVINDLGIQTRQALKIKVWAPKRAFRGFFFDA
jgi:hypothetical protein